MTGGTLITRATVAGSTPGGYGRYLRMSVARRSFPPAFDVLLAGALAVLALLELFLLEDTEGPRSVQVAATLAMTLPIAWRRTQPVAAAVVIVTAMVAAVLAGVPATEGFVPILVLGLAVYAVARADVLEDEMGEHTSRAVTEERERIARELHDVVAHRLSTIAVQAGAGMHVLHEDLVRARAAFEAIDDTARAGLSEMRQALGLMRARDGGAALAPQPSLRQLENLAGESRAAGVPVSVRVEGDIRTIPAGLDLSAYRIVQEALTNVRRHTSGATARVEVEVDDDRLRVRVADHGGTPSRDPSPNGSGHGLLGIRERVALYDGSLEVGPESDGFVVAAVLPLDGPA